MDSLSGELRVVGGSRTRRGVRRQGRRARHLTAQAGKSPGVPAGTDAACGVAAGGSAHTSNAHAASRGTDAEPAEPKAGQAARTPKTEKTKAPQTKRRTAGRRQKSKGFFQKKDATGTAKGGGGDGTAKPIESLWDERVHLDGGDDLPAEGPGFVDAVNEYVDLVRLTDSLLRERDEKSSKSLLEKLLEMKYGKGGKTELGGVRPIICDLPGPIRD